MEIPADLPAEVPSHWLQYIGTRDVDGTAEAAVRAGGSIVKAPSDMQGAGRYAVLKDPQGAVFAIIDPENARPEAAGAPPLGTFSWHELATSDNEAAFAFYSGLFGWDAMQRMDMGPAGVYLIFGQNGVQRGGIYIKPADMPGPPNWLPYVHVPNADDGFAVAIVDGRAREPCRPWMCRAAAASPSSSIRRARRLPCIRCRPRQATPPRSPKPRRRPKPKPRRSRRRSPRQRPSRSQGEGQGQEEGYGQKRRSRSKSRRRRRA